MQIIQGTKNIVQPIPYPVVALGNFDGVHLAHQMIFRKTVEQAEVKAGTASVITFEPHPLQILAPEKMPPLLTVFSQKMGLIEACGIELVICEEFTPRFAGLDPREFVRDFIVKGLQAKEVVVGYDYAFGKNRQGSVSLLRQLGEEFGFSVDVIEPVTWNEHIVGSSEVRSWIEQGDMERAAELLGRPYSLQGPVVKGTRTGSKIGIPTANIDPGKQQVPGIGVYAAFAVVDGQRYRGVVNVGVNPTFHRDKLSVEVHLVDFNESIYDREIEVIFIHRLRDEIRFASPKALVAQIKKDIETAKVLLAKYSN